MMAGQVALVFVFLILLSSPDFSLQACAPPTFHNPYGVIIDPPQENYTDWSLVELSCENGTTPSGPDYAYCWVYGRSSDWSPDVSSFLCYASCSADEFDSDMILTPSPNGQNFVDHGTTVTFNCSGPATIVGSDGAVCRNGTWDVAAFPYCEDTDCSPPTIDNPYGVIIDPLQDRYSEWSRVDLSCVNGTTSYGPDYSYCESSRYDDWNPDVSGFLCYASCSADEFDSDVILTPSPNDQNLVDHGDTVRLGCSDPATIVGPSRAQCLNGTWNIATFPYCQDPTTFAPLPTTFPPSPPSTSTPPPPPTTITTTTTTTTPVPPTPGDGPVSSACLHCMWAVVANCQVPNPTCQANPDGELACGPYQITEKYWQAARIDGDQLGEDWIACASTFECSERAVQGFMTLFANECRLGHEPTCEDFAKMHYGGPEEYDSAEAKAFWTHVEICLNP